MLKFDSTCQIIVIVPRFIYEKVNNYTNEEGVFMVKIFSSGASLRRVRDLCANKFNTRPRLSAGIKIRTKL